VSNSGKPPPKPLRLAPLARVFDADPRIAAWTARRSEEAALTSLVRRRLPRPLAEQVHVAGSRDRVLELAAAGGAAAAAVRQRTPELAETLRREGWDFTEIRIRVQVSGGSVSPQKPVSRQIDGRSASLFDLAGRLPDGPLKQALDRWSRRARGRSSE